MQQELMCKNELPERKTKIVATLGPATDTPEKIGQMIDAGMNVARLNMSHATHDWASKIVPMVRKAAADRGVLVGIIMDTQGPAIRTGNLQADLNLKPGEKFTLTVRGEKSEETHSVDVNYENFVNDISVGDIVLIDNGEIEMKVLAKFANKIECQVLTPGVLGSRRHINLPGVKVSLPALTNKDLEDIALGLELEVDYIALSFVREARDILQLREIMQKSAHKPSVVAKIEDQQAVTNLDTIIQETDAIMIARGDLGIECPYQELPIIQRKVVKMCLRLGKPVIVATHMLESMIENPMPTRAEITDVANAVFEQASAIMLSGESSVGQYPVKCVEVFDKISRRIEMSGGAGYYKLAELTTPRQKLVKSAVVMADELQAKAIVVFTVRGNMARNTAWMRPRSSLIYAFCEDAAVARKLTLEWGVSPLIMEFKHERPEETIDDAMDKLVEDKSLVKGDKVVVVSSITSCKDTFDAVQMRFIR
ncbi:MAG: pyruvate kinase [Verrucomicrobia bacterium]|nr:pyruvate kinase [Verrucomicrobiota bacterium]